MATRSERVEAAVRAAALAGFTPSTIRALVHDLQALAVLLPNEASGVLSRLDKPEAETPVRRWAREVVESCAGDIDYIGVAEQHEEAWTGLPDAERDSVHRAVYDLACSATVTVSWPSQDGGQ